MIRKILQGVSLLSGGLVSGFLLLAASRHAAAQEPSFVVTSDTPQYCAQLGREVVARQGRAQDIQRGEVQHLLNEGRDMCDRGQVRGGIARLRRALVILRHKPAAGP